MIETHDVKRLGLPFAHLNLRRNPFGDLPLDERGALAVTELERFVEPLSRPGFALQILGKRGRGKTTQLLALRRHFPDAPYIHYPEDGPRPEVPRAPLLFLDEMQRFSRKERRNFFRRKASFVVATHEDHSPEFEAAGLRFHSLHLQGVSHERLREVLTRRVEAARRGPGPLPFFEAQVIDQLIEHFGDDLRAIEGHLYEVFQGLEGVAPVRLNL